MSTTKEVKEESKKSGFHFLIDPSDTVTVSIEIYGQEVNGKIIPKLIDKERLKEVIETLREAIKDTDRLIDKATSGSSNTDVHRFSQERIELLKALDDSCNLRDIETTKVTAIFKIPDWSTDAIIRQQSYVEGAMSGTKVWDETANRRALFNNLFVDWDLVNTYPNGTTSKVPKSQYEKVFPPIIDGLLNELNRKLLFTDTEQKN